MKQILRALKTTELLSKIFYILAAIILIALFMLMFGDVSGRFLLNSPINGTTEVSEFLLVAVAFLGLGYAQLTKQHVFVQILITHFPKKLQAWLNVILMLLASAFFIIMTLETGNRAYKDLIGKVFLPNTTVKLPVWWVSFIASVGCALLVLILLVEVVKTIIKLKRGEQPT